jgi:hypothetical protein
MVYSIPLPSEHKLGMGAMDHRTRKNSIVSVLCSESNEKIARWRRENPGRVIEQALRLELRFGTREQSPGLYELESCPAEP